MRDNENLIYKTDFFAVELVDGENRYVSKVNYLEMLNYVSKGNSIKQLKELLPTMENPIEDICLLLSVKNWRPHLLACGASVLINKSSAIVDALWDRFDRTSWVSPQIAATLSLVDENFCQNSFKRLTKGVLIKEPDEFRVKLNETNIIKNPKGFMALLGLLKKYYSDSDFLENEEVKSMVPEMESKDHDQSSLIAQNWRNDLVEAINA